MLDSLFVKKRLSLNGKLLFVILNGGCGVKDLREAISATRAGSSH